MIDAAGARERLRFLADVVTREAQYLTQTDWLQETLAGTLLTRLLDALLESVGSVLDNLDRAERLGWIRSASDWAALRMLRNRMVHEYLRDAQELVDALAAAHAAVPDLDAAASELAARARASAGA